MWYFRIPICIHHMFRFSLHAFCFTRLQAGSPIHQERGVLIEAVHSNHNPQNYHELVEVRGNLRDKYNQPLKCGLFQLLLVLPSQLISKSMSRMLGLLADMGDERYVHFSLSQEF